MLSPPNGFVFGLYHAGKGFQKDPIGEAPALLRSPEKHNPYAIIPSTGGLSRRDSSISTLSWTPLKVVWA
jgi:hypothetical protein